MKVSYEDAHLIVAAVRVLTHGSKKPPTPEKIADLLNLPSEFVRGIVIALGDKGILKVVENPFETRVELGDHTGLEDLPRETEEPSIKDELDDFLKKKKEKEEETEKMLSLDEMEKKKKAKMSDFDEQMKKMKKDPQLPPNT